MNVYTRNSAQFPSTMRHGGTSLSTATTPSSSRLASRPPGRQHRLCSKRRAQGNYGDQWSRSDGTNPTRSPLPPVQSGFPPSFPPAYNRTSYSRLIPRLYIIIIRFHDATALPLTPRWVSVEGEGRREGGRRERSPAAPSPFHPPPHALSSPQAPRPTTAAAAIPHPPHPPLAPVPVACPT